LSFRAFVAWFFLLLGVAWAQPGPGLRVGVLSYEDATLPPKGLGLPGACLAIGSYAELLHWIRQEFIDVAVVSPGLYRQLPPGRWTYLASRTGEEAAGSCLVVRKDSAITGLEQLRNPALQVLAVDPHSVSGFLVPMDWLTRSGIVIDAERLSFTHSHNNVLRALADSKGPCVAFCWESTWRRHSHPDLRKLEVEGLGQQKIPPMALIARSDLATLPQLRQQIARNQVSGFSYDPKYLELLASLPGPPVEVLSAPGRDRVHLDDLVWTLQHYNRTHSKPARLGVVLSGGGAKCAYQAGAVRALEEHLGPELDIQLVVGTSGGAVNALGVALGLTSQAETFEAFRRAWGNLDQRELIMPPLAVRINMWLWFSSIALLTILVLERQLGWNVVRTHVLTLLVGLGIGVFFHLPIKPWYWLGTDSNVQHFWTWLSRGLEGAGWILVGVALLGLWKRRRVPTLLLIFGVTVLPLFQTWNILFYQAVVSENRGLEEALRRNFASLLSSHGIDKKSNLQQLSREVAGRKLLKRDLVIAASPLTDPKLKLPAEYYFYAQVSDHKPVRFGKQGVSLAERPELLFDSVMASAALYPFFPSRKIDGLPSSGHSVDLVDGGFAHCSPLEAAVLWGATHIVSIEASPQEVAPRGNLFSNVAASLTFLHQQAQLVDLRLRGQTVLYTLYPSSPHIGVMDFSENLIQASIDKGYREARGVPTQMGNRGGSLEKELGPPVF